MYIILEMPLEAYLLCISRFKVRTAEYFMLRNGITLTNDLGQRVVHIRCDSEKTTPFLNMVSDICPDFIDKIRQLPDTPTSG